PPASTIVSTSSQPAAAAAPVRNHVSKEKNEPYDKQCPNRTSPSDKTANRGSDRRAQPKNPAAMINNGTATCRGRSSVRSEWTLFNTIKAIVTALIALRINPTPRSLLPVSDLIISGAQNEYP